MRNAVEAHLDIHALALRHFRAVTADWTDATLREPLAADASWTRRRVMAHVVRCLYFPYFVWIQEQLGLEVVPPPAGADEVRAMERMAGFNRLLDRAQPYAERALARITDADLEKVFAAPWGERYSIDQMLEHAACHLWRHARQILRDDAAKGRRAQGADPFAGLS